MQEQAHGTNQIQLRQAHTIMLCQSMSYSRDTIKVAESLNSHLEKLCFGIWKMKYIQFYFISKSQNLVTLTRCFFPNS